MDILTQQSLVSRLSQPGTFFAIACMSLSILAVASVWRNQRTRAGGPEENKTPSVNIVLPDDRRETVGRQDPSLDRIDRSDKSSHISKIAYLLSACASISQKLRSTSMSNHVSLAALAALQAEFTLIVAALCQVQQLSPPNSKLLSSQEALASVFETAANGLATTIDALGKELGGADGPRGKDPSQKENLLSKHLHHLRNYRVTLDFVNQSLQSAFQTQPDSLNVATAADTAKARTPGNDLKSWIERPPEIEDLPAYSPPSDADQGCLPAGSSASAKVSDEASLCQLHVAIAANQIAEVKRLLETGVDPNAPYGRLQRTAQHEAARNNRAEVMRLLLESGGLVDADDSKGDTALHLAAWEGCSEVAEILLPHNAEIDRLSGRDGYSPLWCAISGRHIDVARLLLRHGARLSIRSPADLFPLHQAAVMGQTAMCELLLDRGAHVNCLDREKNTPLHYGATTGSVKTVRLLIENDADVNSRQKEGLSPLHWAAHKGHKDTVKLLLDSGADIDLESETSTTPLHCAASRGHLACVKILLERGADPSVRTSAWDGSEGTAAELARINGHSQVSSLAGYYSGGK